MVVVWRVTERCNLSCRFCAYDRRLDRPRRDADPEQIARFGSVLSEYQRISGDRVLVSWLGGEPLLWPPLERLSAQFHREFQLRISATTNGTFLGSAPLRAHLLDTYSELTISIDGFESFHDSVRGWTGGFETLRQSVRSLARAKRLRGQGPLLRANTILMRDNFGDFRQLCLELAAWGFDEITFNELGGQDRPEFHRGHRLSRLQADRLRLDLPGLREELSSLGLRLLGGPAYLQRLRASAYDEAIPIADCRPGERFLFIDPRGMTAPCSFTTSDYGVCLTELTSAKSLAALPARWAAQRAARLAVPCQDCRSTQFFGKFAHA